MGSLPIKIKLLETVKVSELGLKLSSDPRIEVDEIIKKEKFNYRKYKQGKHFQGHVIINIEKANIEWVVFSGLYLRNAGYQVFITELKDYEELIELITDINQGLIIDNTLQTELLVTDQALIKLGNVQAIVERFEKEFL